MRASKAEFVKESKGAYGYGSAGNGTLRVDEMRVNEFPQMKGSVYLDHAGATMYSKTQLDATFRELSGELFTNPHSAIGCDQVKSTSAKIDHVKRRVLAFFSASEEEYTVVFTSGATAALKLVGESFPWSQDSTYAHSIDSHTSVLGIRGYAAARGSTITCVGLDELEALECGNTNNEISLPAATEFQERSTFSLFAYPAECNFSGVRHSLSIVDKIRAGSWKNAQSTNDDPLPTKWFTLLDAAKYVSTHRLDLSVHRPDFVVLSFYKIFGYPTGLGALIVRKRTLSYLKKPYYGGGAVKSILASRHFTIPLGPMDKDSSAGFADGTHPFLSILALRHGIDQVEMLGMAAISDHTMALRKLLLNKLGALKHWNNVSICEIYGKNGDTTKQQGPIVACNFVHPDGSYVGYSEVHKLAKIHGIHLRTGCFCNPGACQHYLGLKESDLMSNIAAGHVCGDDIDLVNGLPTGAVRISLGYMTTFEDVMAFVEFATKYFVSMKAPAASKTVTTLLVSRNSCDTISRGPYLHKITLFPIKSCAGMVIDEWPIGSRGLLFDREFAVVDLSTGAALTLKTMPELCFIQPVVDLGRETLTISYYKPSIAETQQPSTTEQSPESHPTLTISLRSGTSVLKCEDGTKPRSIRVCTDNCKGRDVSSEASQWLSSCLGRQCALVRVSNIHLRPSLATRSTTKQISERSESRGLADLAKGSNGHEATIGFANQAQYLLISRQSISHFNAVLQSVDSSMAVNETSFRANLVVDGCSEPFEEDQWKSLSIGSGVFDVSGPCSRCSVINLDPRTGQFNRQPLQVLSSYRRQRSSIFFGQFLTARSSDHYEDLLSPHSAADSNGVMWLHVNDPVVVEVAAESADH